jgi:hypothetical protein
VSDVKLIRPPPWSRSACPSPDPLVGLAITLVILRITWQSWRTVRGHHAHVE